MKIPQATEESDQTTDWATPETYVPSTEKAALYQVGEDRSCLPWYFRFDS